MPRFSDEILAELPLEPKRGLSWAQCPWCAGAILLGFRRDRPLARGKGGMTLLHTALLPTTGEKSALLVLNMRGECERYADLSPDQGELARQLRLAATAWHDNAR